ncbi:MAG: nucleoside triphosphate pyrophosphohydrolase [Proteobacteria bacterium]|nr:nucleoside triphosphate pyrophosphohydrolase [Pseudomonadota bacterium]
MKELEKLLQIMRDLRNPDGGCPWDIKQSFSSIAAYTVEEAYEVADAIERDDLDDLKGELGDLLFQVVFHAQMASEQGRFDFVDVVAGINDKLIRRHPHVFADDKTTDEAQLNRDWEKHKKTERAMKGEGDAGKASLLDGVASTMPALRWSEKLQKRASHHGFDWDNIGPVFDKLNEEVAELKAEIVIDDNHERISDEMGDILFASVSLARHLKVNPEQAMRDANRKFISRFEVVEQLLRDDGKQMEECTVPVLEAYWRKAKENLAAKNAKDAKG